MSKMVRHELVGEMVIVETFLGGAYFGRLCAADDDGVILSNASKIAIRSPDILQISKTGTYGPIRMYDRIETSISLDAIEIFPLTKDAEEMLLLAQHGAPFSKIIE